MYVEDGMLEAFYELLLTYSVKGRISFLFAIELAKKALGLDAKTARNLLRELFFLGLCVWDKGQIKIRKPESLNSRIF